MEILVVMFIVQTVCLIFISKSIVKLQKSIKELDTEIREQWIDREFIGAYRKAVEECYSLCHKD